MKDRIPWWGEWEEQVATCVTSHKWTTLAHQLVMMGVEATDASGRLPESERQFCCLGGVLDWIEQNQGRYNEAVLQGLPSEARRQLRRVLLRDLRVKREDLPEYGERDAP